MHPLTRARLRAWLVAGAIGGVLLVAWTTIDQHEGAPSAAPQATRIDIDRSAHAQQERHAVVEKMIADGLVRRIDRTRNGSPRIVLRPAFYQLDPHTRQRLVEAVYGLHFDGSRPGDTVYLRDSRHGNEVGDYNPYTGGLRMVR
jgi:hypothetical protein